MLAKERDISDLVDASRAVGSMWQEELSNAHGGSFRYWVKRKMVLGINVSGAVAETPKGKLDVWVRQLALAEVTGVEEAAIRSSLNSYSLVAKGQDYCVVRLSTRDEALRLVNQLNEWGKRNQAGGLAA